MAELALDDRAELTERLVVFRNEEERVVAESVVTARRMGDPTATTLTGAGQNPRLADRPARPAQTKRGRAAIRPGASAIRPREELAVVGLVVAMNAGITRGVDARRAVEGVNGQPRVVRQNPMPRVLLAVSDAFLRALPAKVSASSANVDLAVAVVESARIVRRSRRGFGSGRGRSGGRARAPSSCYGCPGSEGSVGVASSLWAF